MRSLLAKNLRPDRTCVREAHAQTCAVCRRCSPLVATLLGLLMSNIGIIPSSSPHYAVVNKFLLPLVSLPAVNGDRPLIIAPCLIAHVVTWSIAPYSVWPPCCSQAVPLLLFTADIRYASLLSLADTREWCYCFWL